MTRPVAFAAALAITAAIAVPAFASTKSVKIGDNYFVKPGGATVTVKKGTTVRWKWTGSVSHNVFVKSGPRKFHSAFRTSGTYSHKMTVKGTYKIICQIHLPGMRMTLKVK